jgi:hypothetical protein
MKFPRLANEPAALLDFYQQGLEALGAICERTWHDRLHLVAEGFAARPWNADGALVEADIHFVPPGDTNPRDAVNEVFPGCPLTFRLVEQLRSSPLPLERGVLQSAEQLRAPTFETAERLWLSQMPGTTRWKMTSIMTPSWHFALLALARCEIQAIDQHWTLHRLAVSLPDGLPDDGLAQDLDFAQLHDQVASPSWPVPDPGRWAGWLRQAVEQELEGQLVEIRQRQQRYLRRELERIDHYFDAYEREIAERQRRAHAESSKLKVEERLVAAKSEHGRRREDQLHRHEIRVIVHLDALLLLAESAWQTQISYLEKGETKRALAQFVPRARRWVILTENA